MDFIMVWGIIGIVAYLCFAIKDFWKCDWGIRKEFLTNKNRERWQKKNAVIELGIAIFGALSICSYSVLQNKPSFFIFAIVTLILFFLSLANGITK